MKLRPSILTTSILSILLPFVLTMCTNPVIVNPLELDQEQSSPITTLSLNTATLTLLVSETEALTATVRLQNTTNQTITWTSTDDLIATVDGNGIITALTARAATITVTTVDDNNKTITGMSINKPNADYINSTQANYNEHLRRTSVVGSYAPNVWGLYDMHGNMDEWCWDRQVNYDFQENVVVDDPAGPSSGNLRVFRGGNWSSIGQNLRSAARSGTFRIIRPAINNEQ